MPDRVVLDVIDRPAVGLCRVLMHARATRAAGPRGMRALLVLGTGHFVPRVRPTPTPRRMALLSVWGGRRRGGLRRYLGGLAVTSSPLNTTSCGCWRTYGDAKDYAFNAGDHAEAMRRDPRDERHKTEWFLRLRPLAERGTSWGRRRWRRSWRPPEADRSLTGERAPPPSRTGFAPGTTSGTLYTA